MEPVRGCRERLKAACAEERTPNVSSLRPTLKTNLLSLPQLFWKHPQKVYKTDNRDTLKFL